MLNRLNYIPDGLLECSASEIFKILQGPTLIELEGTRKQPLFLSVLLHGNETSGWEVTKNILARYTKAALPRSLILFIGNVEAASQDKRRLASQPDYNRIWIDGDTAEHKMIQGLLNEMANKKLFASIDIHNNTGINPHYACINHLDFRFINLARKFTRMVIYFVRPSGVQSKAFAEFCPSVTLECGQAGDEYGIQLASNFVDEILNSDEIANEKVDDSEIDLFHTVGVIKVKNNASISFDEQKADITFIKGIENLNFEEIPAGTPLASLRRGITDSFHMLNEDGKDISHELFELQGNSLLSKINLMPAMLTMDEKIIRQDCLCYVMERYQIGMGEKLIEEAAPLWIN